MKTTKLQELKKQYENVCNEYLRKFCNKQGFVFDNDMWVNQDVGSTVMCNDMFLNFSDIVWDINSKQPKGAITEWYYECLENIEKSINYFSYTKGLRIVDLK